MRSICGWHKGFANNNNNSHIADFLKDAIQSDNDQAEVKIYGSDWSCVALANDRNIYKYSDKNYDVILHGLEGKKIEQSGDSGSATILETFVARYRKDNVDALKILKGAFTLVLIDKITGETLVAVDRMGVHSISYTTTDDGVLYASSNSMYRSFPNSRLELNNQAIYNYLYFHVIPGPETIYKNVKKINPGGYLRVCGDKADTGYYWQIEYNEDKTKNFNQHKDELFGLLEKSLNEYVSEDNVGAFLSGGIDSSTVVGFFSKTKKEPVKTFTIGFEEKGYDESNYAAIAVERYQSNHHTYFVTPDDVLNAIPKIAEKYDQPFGNSSAVPAYYCAKMAKENGVTTLLAGDGGDELFGGNERYAKQYIFSLYDNIPSIFKNTLFEPLLKPVSVDSSIFPLRKLKRYVEQANIPMPQRLETYNLLESFGVENVLEDDFLAEVSTEYPHEMQRTFYNNTKADGLLNRMLALDLKYAIADNDLPKVTQMCNAAGVDVSFPFLNDNIVEFSTKLPANYKVRRTKLRYFFKKALDGFLPEEIIKKPKHGFGQPFGIWINEHSALKEFVFDSLNSLKQRKIVKSDFIDNLLGKYLSVHPHYYGNMVWVLLMLEQWYQQHID
jgi:asparagine synthase (glutamine-hydrolysing)